MALFRNFSREHWLELICFTLLFITFRWSKNWRRYEKERAALWWWSLVDRRARLSLGKKIYTMFNINKGQRKCTEIRVRTKTLHRGQPLLPIRARDLLFILYSNLYLALMEKWFIAFALQGHSSTSHPRHRRSGSLSLATVLKVYGESRLCPMLIVVYFGVSTWTTCSVN